VSVGDRLVQQARLVGLLPRIEQLARAHPWLDGARSGDGNAEGVESQVGARAREPRNDDGERDEQDLKNQASGHRQRDHPAYALTLRSRTPQLVRFPGLAAVASRGRQHGKDSGTPMVKVQRNDLETMVQGTGPLLARNG